MSQNKDSLMRLLIFLKSASDEEFNRLVESLAFVGTKLGKEKPSIPGVTYISENKITLR